MGLVRPRRMNGFDGVHDAAPQKRFESVSTLTSKGAPPLAYRENPPIRGWSVINVASGRPADEPARVPRMHFERPADGRGLKPGESSSSRSNSRSFRGHVLVRA